MSIAACSWNVEGLTDTKLHEIQIYMRQTDIHICCMQETRRCKSDYFLDNGHLVILSGRDDSEKKWAGVGFVICPQFARHLVGFNQFNDRIASLRLRVDGGVVAFFSVYAPHNLKELDERCDFYEQLSHCYSTTSANGPKIILGDMNAKIGQRRRGEEDVLGDFCFGVEASHRVEVPNRDFLMEFCWGHGLIVANTKFDNPVDCQATFRAPGAEPAGSDNHNGLHMLDLVLVASDWEMAVLECKSDRWATLASHHSPVKAVFAMTMGPDERSERKRTNWAALCHSDLRKQFASQIATTCSDGSDESWEEIATQVRLVADSLLPEQVSVANKPWISDDTLRLINQKAVLRNNGDWVAEKEARKAVKQSAKRDRARWLEALAASGDWKSLRKLRGGKRQKQGRLQDMTGKVVDSELRAETFAEYLEKIQWKVRQVTLVPGADPPLNDPMPISCDSFVMPELRKAIGKMSSGKATKKDDIPIECFKALAAEGDEYLEWLLSFCNRCWESKSVPQSWSTASVALLYKKGPPGMCENYRPICLLTVAGKLLASMLKDRLVRGGADKHLWPSQFGFRAGRGTDDAICIARRRLETANAQRKGRLVCLALDWRKAFDSLSVPSLLDALRRFGLPTQVLDMIQAMLACRQFIVEDCGSISTSRPQLSGISQGCTLSPFLFVMAMTVLLHDAVQMLSSDARNAYEKGSLGDLVYADDTLLIGIEDHHVAEYLHAVEQAGQRYGMELHADKFQLISVGCAGAVCMPDGRQVVSSEHMGYLGTVLAPDGTNDRELSRRIGVAKADFVALSRVWSQSALTRAKKLHIFSALVESKLFYSLASMCLTVAQQRRLDGFQNRCVRKILGIKPAFISRVSNKCVLQQALHPSATQILRIRRLQMFGQILRAPPAHPMRRACFINNTLWPVTEQFVRRVGRPRKEWVKELVADCSKLFGSLESSVALAQDKVSWNRLVRQKVLS